MADDGGIQKPTSAYQYFYKDHIQVIRSQTQGTLDISKVGGQTSAAWHALDAAAKAPYERLAAQDRARYEKESSEADAAKEEAQAAARAAYSAAEATGPRTTRAPLAPPPRERKVTAPEDLTDEQRERRDARKAEVAAARAERQKRADEVEKQRQAVQEAHRNQAQKRLRYLLAQSDIFRTHFGLGQVAEAEVEPEPAAKAPPAAAPGSAAKRRAASPEAAPGDGSEEAVEADAEGPPTFLTAQPPSIKGSMRAYQLEGLNWMINLQTQGINGVLADEMGLGKTLQSISILAYMRDFRGISGPHLVLLPKSTLGNWRGEFATFCPALRVLPLHGDRAEREALIEQRLRPGVPQEERDWDVCLTTYEVARMEVKSLEKIGWRYLIIDEAHKLKNENSQVSGTARAMNADHRLLLTGTPLQNNLHELWALLNILLPDVFADASQFSEFFNLDTGDTDAKKTVITQLHKILRPFMLRRLKSDAAKELPPKTETILYTRLSDMQRRLYRDLLMRNIDCVNSTGAGIQRTALLNIVMQLRKCCNHPYLFPGMEDRSLDPLGEHLVDACGKVKLLDKLLSRLKERGHRVLVFSQMTRMLDILEDLMHMRGHEYCRIDGDTSYDQRDELIDAYNAPNSTKFCFLLSTRAGGLGINLQTADVVILFDSDWNPQADLQAQDRAHRIGQRRAVRVFRLVTEDTVEEKVVERAQQKLKLDAMVVQQGRLQEKAALGKDDILQALRFGADSVFRSEGAEVTDEDIDIILAKGEAKTAALNEKLSQMEKGDLLDFRLDGGMSTQTFEGKDFSDRANRQAQQGWFGIDTGKRHRKPVDMLTAAPPAPAPAPPKKVLKLPPSLAVPPMHGWQLYDMARIQALQQQAHDKLAALREAGNEVPEDGPTLEAILFTPEEVEERRRLLTEGFAGWGSRHLIRLYVDACTQFGRHSHAKIARAVGKTEEEVAAYTKAFWELGPTRIGPSEWERWSSRIDKGEKRAAEVRRLERAAAVLVSRWEDPWRQLEFKYTSQPQGRAFTLDEDRHLLCHAVIHGWGAWGRVRDAVMRTPRLSLDCHLRSLSTEAIGRRCEALMRAAEKELLEGVSRRRAEAARRNDRRAAREEAARIEVAEKSAKLAEAESAAAEAARKAADALHRRYLLEQLMQGITNGVIHNVKVPTEEVPIAPARPPATPAQAASAKPAGKRGRQKNELPARMLPRLMRIVNDMGMQLKNVTEMVEAFRAHHPSCSQRLVTSTIKNMSDFQTREIPGGRGQSRKRWWVKPEHEHYLFEPVCTEPDTPERSPQAAPQQQTNGQAPNGIAEFAAQGDAQASFAKRPSLSTTLPAAAAATAAAPGEEGAAIGVKRESPDAAAAVNGGGAAAGAAAAEPPAKRRRKHIALTGYVLYQRATHKETRAELPRGTAPEVVEARSQYKWESLTQAQRDAFDAQATATLEARKAARRGAAATKAAARGHHGANPGADGDGHVPFEMDDSASDHEHHSDGANGAESKADQMDTAAT